MQTLTTPFASNAYIQQPPRHQNPNPISSKRLTSHDAVLHTWESTEMMLPKPSVEAKGWCCGTTTGHTETDSLSPPGDTTAVPCSLMVDRISSAYSRSTAVRGDTPLGSICFIRGRYKRGERGTDTAAAAKEKNVKLGGRRAHGCTTAVHYLPPVRAGKPLVLRRENVLVVLISSVSGGHGKQIFR